MHPACAGSGCVVSCRLGGVSYRLSCVTGGGYLIIESNKPAGPPTHRARRRKRKIEKKEMHLMKKRLISFLLALCMALSLVPVGAVAQSAVTTIPVSGGKPSANSGTGWSYGSKKLTLTDGSFELSSNLGDVEVVIQKNATLMPGSTTTFGTASYVTNHGTIGQSGTTDYPQFSGSVHNYGNILGGQFNYHVYNHSGGHIKGGEFHSSYSVTNDTGGYIDSGTFNGTVDNSGTINNGTFNGTVSNLSTIKGGSYKLLYSVKEPASTSISYTTLITSTQPSSGSYYTITHADDDAIPFLFAKSSVNSNGDSFEIPANSQSSPLYIKTSQRNQTLTIYTNKKILYVNGKPFSSSTFEYGYYSNTIKLSDYDANSVIQLSTVPQPTAELEIRADTGGKPNIKAEGVVATPNADGTTTYKGKGWEYKPDPDNNNTMTLYITDASITLNSNRVKTNAVRVPIVTKGDIEAGSYTMPVTCRNISGNSFDADVTCNGNISGGVFNKDCTVTISSGHKVTGGAFNGKVINSGEIGKYNIRPGFSGTVINKGTIQNGIFNGPVESSGGIQDGTFNNTVTNTGTIYYKGAFNGAVINKSLILGGTYSTPVTLEGQHGTIRAGLFKQPVTVNGSAEISGGLFIKDVTLAEGAQLNIAGGVFTNDVTGSLKSVTIKNGDTFTANGYTQYPLNTVYIANDSSLNLTAVKALGFINGKKIEPSWNLLSNQDKTVKLNINDLVNNHRISSAANIVLGYALTAPTSDLFTVSGLPQELTYGDSDISTQLSAIAPAKADETANVGAPAVAGFYKLTDDGTLPASPVLLTAAEVKDAGTYAVVLKVDTATDTYSTAPALYNLTNWTFTIGKKAITAADFTFSPPDDLTYDGTAKKATVTETNKVAKNFAVIHTDAAGKAIAEPTNAGTYKVVLNITPDSNHKLESNSLLTFDSWTFEIAKAELTAADFERDDAHHTVKPKNDIKLADNEYTVTFVPAPSALSTLSAQNLPTDAGTYQAYVTVHEDAQNYRADSTLTSDEWVFTVEQEEPTNGLLTVIIPFNKVYTGSAITATVWAKTAEELEDSEIDAPAGPLTGPLTVTYYQLDENNQRVDVDGDPILPGLYYFEITTSGEGNYKAATLTNFSWKFTIAEPENYVHVEGGSAYYMDENDQKVPIVEGTETTEGTKVLAGTKVYLVMNGADTPDDSDTPDVTLLAENEDSEVGTMLWFVDPKTKVALTIENPDEATGAWFTMPRGEVWVTTTKPGDDTPADNIGSGSDAGVGAALVVGGAAIGGAAYLVGTQLWLEANLPAEAAIPTSRQQLADLLWTAAGKPQPQSSVLFTDISAEAIDSQQAARWCVEQGLMQADGTSFKPGKYTFRPQVIKAWNNLQAMQKAG